MVRAATEVWHEWNYLLVFAHLVPQLQRDAVRRMGDLMRTGARG